MKRLFSLVLGLVAFFAFAPQTFAADSCSVNIYPQPTPGTHTYTVTITNNTGTPGYYFTNNYWVDGSPSGNPSNFYTSTNNYWTMGGGLGYSVTGFAGVPIANNSISYNTDLTFSNSFAGIDLAMSSQNSSTNDICNQPHGTYTITYNNLGNAPVRPQTNLTNAPQNAINCSLNIYPQPTPGTHNYTITLTNLTSTPGIFFRNNFWVDGSPSGNPFNVGTTSDWYINHAYGYEAEGTAETSIANNNSVSYTTDLSFNNTFDGVDLALSSQDNNIYDVCNQPHGTYTITYNNPNPNTPPQVGAVTVSPNPALINASVTATTTFTDPDLGQTHFATANWGDNINTATTCSVTEPNGSTPGSVNCPFTGYTAANVYPVTISVSDGIASPTISQITYESVYNPTQSNIFSAGEKYSNPSTANPSTAGNVKFGLTYKYQGGTANSNRAFTMDFNNASLHFSASTVTSLVISNGMATLQGTGTLTGQTGTHNFLVTGVNNGGIRIQITDSSNNVIYDTQPGDPITATPTITTGHVVVQ